MGVEFSWTKQWYPLIPLSYLDASRPTPVALLGKNLVIWRDETKKWVVMDDICPHKLAQLSKGRINEDGTLMCRHHGWCFNSEGKCTVIPMLAGSSAESTASNSLRAKVTTYPTQVNQALLWVWPDDSATAKEDCQLKHPAIIPDSELDVSSTDWHMSEVPVTYTVSVESSFDPSHAQFLHEGIGLFSPKSTVPIKHFEVVGEISAEEGFTLKHTGYNLLNKDMDATRKFTPPCANTTIYRYSNGKSNLFQLYFVPTRSGYCRYIGKFVAGGNTFKRNLVFELLPKYFRTGLQHSLTYKLSDQDLTIMHSQEINESSLHKKWQKAYFMPSPADIGIVTFRKWLDEFAGGNPFWEQGGEESVKNLNDEQLYDRWHRHTKHCPSCRQSVTWLEKVRQVGIICTLLFAVLAAALILLDIPLKLALIPAIFAGLSAVIWYKSSNVRQNFLTSIPKTGLPVVTLYQSNAT